MEEMKEFWLWWFSELPNFLLSEPICYLFGFTFGALAISLIRRIIHL